MRLTTGDVSIYEGRDYDQRQPDCIRNWTFLDSSISRMVKMSMPEISRFLGIAIYMRYRDHPPPHFHVRYAGNSAIIDIETMQILEGQLPARVSGLIAEWGIRHRALLRENWRRAVAREPLLSISPLG